MDEHPDPQTQKWQHDLKEKMGEITQLHNLQDHELLAWLCATLTTFAGSSNMTDANFCDLTQKLNNSFRLFRSEMWKMMNDMKDMKENPPSKKSKKKST